MVWCGFMINMTAGEGVRAWYTGGSSQSMVKRRCHEKNNECGT